MGWWWVPIGIAIYVFLVALLLCFLAGASKASHLDWDE